MIFIDTNIFIYAIGKDHPNKKPCADFILKVSEETITSEKYCSSTEVLQEILHYYTNKGAPEIGRKAFEKIVELPIHFFPVTLEDMNYAKRFLEKYPKLPVRDAVHLGVMKRMKVDQIVSYDKDFKMVSSVDCLRP